MEAVPRIGVWHRVCAGSRRRGLPDDRERCV